MTMRTRYRVVCPCGHEGALFHSENDQPYSEMWESYSLRDLQDGPSHPGTSSQDQLASMGATCPKCGTKLTDAHIMKCR